jgi:hypothetical protein
MIARPTNFVRLNASPRKPGVSLCPFHDGPATLDLLLAEIDSRDTTLFDAVLDLRSAATSAADARECAELLFRVRTLLQGRHHLAFYRVRCWARQALRIEVRASRQEPWIAHELPLNSGRLEEVVNTALATLEDAGGEIPPAAKVRFVFAATTRTESGYFG